MERFVVLIHILFLLLGSLLIRVPQVEIHESQEQWLVQHTQGEYRVSVEVVQHTD